LVASKDKLQKLLNWEAQHSSLEEIVASAWAWKVKHPQGYTDNFK
jgi:UDP-glucose 4-epimerase